MVIIRIWYLEEIPADSRVRLIHGKRAIGVRAIEVLNYKHRFGSISDGVPEGSKAVVSLH